MNINVRDIPQEERKGTTKLENLPEFCITMYGAEKEAREELMMILDGLGVRWASGNGMYESLGAQEVLLGTYWLIFHPDDWRVSCAPILWCEGGGHTKYPHLSLDYFKNLVEDYLYEHS